MRVITRKRLVEFSAVWPAAKGPLNDWYRATKHVRWRNFQEVKAIFGQTDLVKLRSGKTVVVFDIGGNKFRLIARISYEKQKVYVLRVMTHKGYDKDAWKGQL